VIGTLNMLELCRQSGTKKFIFASTSSIYGANRLTPHPNLLRAVNRFNPTRPAKKARKPCCHFLPLFVWLDISVLRFFTVYGPAGRPDLALFVLCNGSVRAAVHVYGDGEQSRGFTYIDDTPAASSSPSSRSDTRS